MPAAARYDGIADWYDTYVTDEVAAFTAVAAAALERLAGHGAGPCLDVGCGTGVLTETLVELGWRVVGVDVSADQLRVARRRLDGRVELVAADALDLPFPDASFDLVPPPSSTRTSTTRQASSPRWGGCCARAGDSSTWACTRASPRRASSASATARA